MCRVESVRASQTEASSRGGTIMSGMSEVARRHSITHAIVVWTSLARPRSVSPVLKVGEGRFDGS